MLSLGLSWIQSKLESYLLLMECVTSMTLLLRTNDFEEKAAKEELLWFMYVTSPSSSASSSSSTKVLLITVLSGLKLFLIYVRAVLRWLSRRVFRSSSVQGQRFLFLYSVVITILFVAVLAHHYKLSNEVEILMAPTVENQRSKGYFHMTVTEPSALPLNVMELVNSRFDKHFVYRYDDGQ